MGNEERKAKRMEQRKTDFFVDYDGGVPVRVLVMLPSRIDGCGTPDVTIAPTRFDGGHRHTSTCVVHFEGHILSSWLFR